MNKREKTFVYTGAIVVSAIILFALALNPSLRGGGEVASRQDVVCASFFDLRSQMEQTLANRRAIAKLENTLGVRVSPLEPSQQLQSFVELVEKLGKKCGAKIKHITPRNRSASRSRSAIKAEDKISLAISFDASHEGLVEFVAALQNSQWPVVFRSIDIKSTPKTLDKLSVNMEFYTYIFDGQERE